MRSSKQGFAIGPILMVIALLAVLGSLLAGGMGAFSTNATVDRIRSEIRGQANLIRAKVQECYMVTMGNSGFGYPTSSNVQVRNLDCPGDPTGQQNLWRGARPASLPPPVPGFSEWMYFNYAKGRCIVATPGSAGSATKDGLTAVSTLFNANEVYLNTAGDWSISIWLTPIASPVKCGT